MYCKPPHSRRLGFSVQPHKTVLEKHGKPDDLMVGVKNHKERLPPTPLSGMYNKSGGRVRLTFKLEQDQLWIGTKGQSNACACSVQFENFCFCAMFILAYL